jgi:hypothetical protein
VFAESNLKEINMKTLLLSVLGGAAFIGAVETTSAQEVDPQETCKEFYGLAEVVMGARHEGVPMPEVMALITNKQPVFISIVRDAYDFPRMRTEKNQRETAVEFANGVFAECLEAFD